MQTYRKLRLSRATTAKLFTPPSHPLDLTFFLAADTRAESPPQRLRGPNRLDRCDTPPNLPQRRPWGISTFLMYTIRTTRPYRYSVAFVVALRSLPPLPCLKCEGSSYPSFAHPTHAGPSPLCLRLLRPPFASRFLFLFTIFALLTLFFEHHACPALPPRSSIFGAFFFRGPVFISASFFVVVSLCSLSFPSTLCVVPPPVLAAPVRQWNFISMSDDEDEARDDKDV